MRTDGLLSCLDVYKRQPVTGSAVSTFVNNDIAWEKKKTTNVGIDLAMFNNRLELSLIHI